MSNALHEIDHSSYELGAIRITLRNDLSIRRQSFGKADCYVIEDPALSKFYRIGVPEYTFVSLLDGQTSIAEAVAETASRIGNEAFTETQAAALCSWLISCSLATTSQSTTDTRLIEGADRAAIKRRSQWINPIMLKLPLGSPDHFVRRITPLTSWAFGFAGIAIWMIVAIIGLYNVSIHWNAWTTQNSNVFSPDNWLWLGITWLALKVAHELAHAVACRRFGGECRESGILFLLFVPLPYVDVTSAWRFGSKWQRIIVSAAGMYVEFFLAACAAIAWTQTDSALVQHHAFNVIVTAGFMTLLFNINPLMKFDGYYILSDALDMPNLATHGQQDLMYLCRRWLLGNSTERPQWPEGKSAFIRTYGVAAFVWRILICVSITLAAESLYYGAGIVLAVAAVCLWVVVPLVKFIRFMVMGNPVNPPNRLRFLAILTTASLFAFATANYVPYVERLQLAAIVDYDPVVSVRSGTSGFVKTVDVISGQQVHEGEILVTLENIPLSSRLRETELAITQSQLDATRYHRQGNLAAFQVELENESALETRRAELQSQFEQLVVRAPIDGRILTSDIDDLQDRWFTSGSELIVMGDDSKRSLHIVIPQSRIDVVRSDSRQIVSVHVWGSGSSDFSGAIAAIDPRGTTSLRHPALAAVADGPLAVQSAAPSENSKSGASAGDWQLLEPHFNGRVEIDRQHLNKIGTGQRGIVEFTTTRGTIGNEITRRLESFIAKRKFREAM